MTFIEISYNDLEPNHSIKIQTFFIHMKCIDKFIYNLPNNHITFIINQILTFFYYFFIPGKQKQTQNITPKT